MNFFMRASNYKLSIDQCNAGLRTCGNARAAYLYY